MADLISLEEITAQIESTDYTNPASVEELKLLLERADAAYAVSSQYDNFIEVRKKYEEKMRNPQASQSSAGNASEQHQFEDIKGNQERREYLETKINREGDLVLTPNERAFLAEQIANGNMYDQLQDGDKIMKIARALDSEEYEKNIREKVLHQLDAPDQVMVPGNETFIPNTSKSFGDQILKDMAGAAPKETMADLQQQVMRLSANIEAYGETQGNISARRELISKIRELQEASKGIFNYNTRRKLNSQLKKIDPAYYDTKVVTASAVMAPYYRARIALRDRNNKRRAQKTQNLETRYNKVTTLQNVINEKPFWSRHMGANIAARLKLFGNCLAEGRLTAQGVTNKYAKRLNLTTAAQQIASLDTKLAELKERTAENPRTRARLQTQIQQLEAQKAAFSTRAEKISAQHKMQIGKSQVQADPVKQKVRNRLEKMAASLEKSRLETIKSGDRYKALIILQSRGGLSAEQKKELDAMVNGMTEKAITAENIYEKILRESGVKGDELAAKIAELFPPREAESSEQARQTYESNTGERETAEKGKDEVSHNNDAHADSVVTHVERKDGEEIKTYKSGLEVSQPDENTYNISGRDGKAPTDEQCAEFVNQLKDKHYESFSLAEDITPEFYDSTVKAAEAAGMTIENKEKMENKFRDVPRESFSGDGRIDGGDGHGGDASPNGGQEDKKEKEPFKLQRNKDGRVMLTEVQIMALDSEGRLDMGGLRQQFKFDEQGKLVDGPSYADFAKNNPQHSAYLEELGLGEQHIKDMLKREARENDNLTEAQIQALDAEGRNVIGGEKTYKDLLSQDKAYLEDEGLGKNYNRKVERNTEFMIDSNISAKDITVEKMDLLAQVQGMSSEEFKKFQAENSEYKKLPANQRKLVDAVNDLTNNQEFKSRDEKKQAMMLGRIVGKYKESVKKEGAKDKAAKQRIIDHDIARHIATQGKSNG